MKRHYSICTVILLFSILFIGSCQNREIEELESPLRMTVVKEIKIGPEAAQYLGRVIHRIPASPTDDLLAITNTESPVNIVIVDYDGNLIDVVGSEGRGPEELLWPRQFGFDASKNVVVYDNDLALFKVFNRYEHTVATYTPPSIKDLKIKGEGFFEGTCHEKWYIPIQSLSGFVDESTPTVSVFDEEFNFLEMTGTYDPLFLEKSGTRSVMGSPNLRIDCENASLYTTHPKVPFFQVYNLENHSLVYRTEAMPPSFKLSDTFVSSVYDFTAHQEYRRDEQSTTMILTHSDQFILSSFFNNTTEFIETRDPTKRDYYVAVYNRDDYSFVGELAVDGTIAGATRQGYLIEVIDDDPENFTIRLLDIGANH